MVVEVDPSPVNYKQASLNAHNSKGVISIYLKKKKFISSQVT